MPPRARHRASSMVLSWPKGAIEGPPWWPWFWAPALRCASFFFLRVRFFFLLWCAAISEISRFIWRRFVLLCFVWFRFGVFGGAFLMCLCSFSFRSDASCDARSRATHCATRALHICARIGIDCRATARGEGDGCDAVYPVASAMELRARMRGPSRLRVRACREAASPERAPEHAAHRWARGAAGAAKMEGARANAVGGIVGGHGAGARVQG